MIRKTAAALLLMAGVLQPAAAQQAVTRQQVDDRKAVIATVEPVRELPARARIGPHVRRAARRRPPPCSRPRGPGQRVSTCGLSGAGGGGRRSL